MNLTELIQIGQELNLIAKRLNTIVEKLNETIREKSSSVEIVDRLPEVAVKDKVIYNKEDKSFYIGKDDKEVN